jgi:hypothetical protein
VLEVRVNTIETNIFPISNLGELNAAYRVYRIRGLQPDHSEYFQNRQAITRGVSFALKTPALVLDSNDGPILIVRSDAPSPQSPMELVRTSVCFDDLVSTRQVDFTSQEQETRQIAIRFLQFMLQGQLAKSHLLWQPGAGKPFYEKQGESDARGTTRYTGFTVRVMPRTEGGLGLCVDVASKFVNSNPLPDGLTRHDFRRVKGRSVLYRYGHRWYEIHLSEISDLSLGEYKISGEPTSLLDFIIAQVEKPAPPEIARLKPTSSVVLYQTNTGELRGAPAALCYPVLDSYEAPTFAGKKRLYEPYQRRQLTRRFVGDYLRSISFGDVKLSVAAEPIRTEQKIFPVPDFEFGNGRILSASGTSGAQHVSLDSLGRVRAALLRDKGAGFYTRGPLGTQLFFMPQSIADTCGRRFLNDLQAMTDEMYPTDSGYRPRLIAYKDRVGPTFIEQGKSILEVAKMSGLTSAYAVVMIHDTRGQRLRQHDQLAALVSRKLTQFDICASVIHTSVVSEAYQLETTSSGSQYVPRREKFGRLSGYLRNVALNKILLTNERWPFVLASKLGADLTIGIDVKGNTAGFTLVSDRGHLVRTRLSTSHQKEKLLSQQVRKLLTQIIREEAQATFSAFESVVIHRDGLLFESERQGILAAVEELRQEGILRSDARCALLELSKTAPAPFRLYDVTGSNGRAWVENPQVGTYYVMDDRNAFVCATGRAFHHEGTVHPLHVRYVDGTLPFGQCLEDVYCLTCLAWTRPEDCTRDPITIKLTDRRLGEDATSFDEDALEYDINVPDSAGVR